MIHYIGVNDKNIDLFEGQYKVKNGISYNSYLIESDKTAIMDTVDISFKDEWLCNIKKVLKAKKLDYLVILHMEPDHSACISALLEEYTDVTIVTNAKAYKMILQFFPEIIIKNYLEIKDNDKLSLGEYELNFIFAPMVHWPEVMLAYEANNKILFSADAFGKFGSLDTFEPWLDEARRYYIGIVGKYGAFVQKLFAKIKDVQINAIYPLHGPILNENLGYYLDLYNKWSSYTPEEDGVLIAYASIYGNTKEAALELSKNLGEYNHEIVDLARCDIHGSIAKAFKYSKLVIASPTYNGGLFPIVKFFIDGLVEREYQNRIIATIDNGTWGPMTSKAIMKSFESSKNISFLNPVILKSSINTNSILELEKLANELKK